MGMGFALLQPGFVKWERRGCFTKPRVRSDVPYATDRRQSDVGHKHHL